MRRRACRIIFSALALLLAISFGRETTRAEDESAPPADAPQETVGAVLPDRPEIVVEENRQRAAALSWDEVENAAGYLVYRADSKDGRLTELKDLKKNSFTDREVKRGRTYFYRVQAYTQNEQGELQKGELSKAVRITISIPASAVRIKSVTATKCTLTWKKVKGAQKYIVCRSEKNNRKFRKIKTTNKTEFCDKKCKSRTKYYYQVIAVGKNSQGFQTQSPSGKEIVAKTKKRVKKIAYIGDSVISGLAEYRVITEKNRRVIYKIGVSAYQFYNGPLLDKLLDYNPDRLYIMMGMNSLGGTPGDGAIDNILKYYVMIIEECLSENPDMEIVILPVSPTRGSATVKNSSVSRFNRRLKQRAKKLGLEYFDCLDFLREKDKTLKQGYSARDGIHWNISAYRSFKKQLDKHDKELN